MANEHPETSELAMTSAPEGVETLAVLSTALAGVSVCVLAIDPDGRIVSANDAAAAIIHHPPSTLIGQSLATLFDAASAAKIRSFLNNGPIFSGYAIHRGLEATLRIDDSDVNADADAKNAPSVSVAILRGVVGAHALALVAEARPNESFTLEKGSTKALRGAGRETIMTPLAVATLMHQMRTPLTTILGFSELMRHDPTVAHNPQRRRQIDAVIRGAQDMRLAMERAVDEQDAGFEAGPIAPISAEISPGAATWIDLSELLRRSAAALAPSAQGAGVKLHLDVADAPARLVSASAALAEAVESVVALAIETVGAGGRVLVHVVRLDDGGCAVEIVDDGFGRMAAIAPSGAPRTVDERQAVYDRRARLAGVRARASAAAARFEYEAIPGAGATARLVFDASALVDAKRG